MSEGGSIYVEGDRGGDKKMTKAVSVLDLVAISFFYVCAGPFGQGEAINAGGAKWTFICTLIIPFVFSVPLALVSSEQASRMPMCGGCNEWGFILGDFWGYTNVFVRTLCSLFDNPIYPVMAVQYMAGFIPEVETNTGYKAIVVLVVNLIVILLNVSGLETVGIWSFLLTFVIIIPFILFFCFGAKFMTPELVFAEKGEEYGEVDWGLLVSTLIWQYCGFDTVASLSEETKNPKRTFPLGLGITILLVTLVYLLPTITGLAVQPDLNEWESAGFGDVAMLLPYCESGWLSHWINIAGILSALSLLNVAVSCTGRETYAGGVFRAFPFSRSFFARLDNNMKKERAPICSLVFMSLVTIPFCFFDFEFLVEWSGLLTVIQQLIQVASFIACRFPKCVARMKKRRSLAQMESAIELAALESQHDSSDSSEKENPENPDEDDEAKEADLSDKFVIPGGWVGVTICLVPLVACCILLCVVEGWMVLLLSCAMVAAMWILKAIDYYGGMCIDNYRKNKANKVSGDHNADDSSDEKPDSENKDTPAEQSKPEDNENKDVVDSTPAEEKQTEEVKKEEKSESSSSSSSKKEQAKEE